MIRKKKNTYFVATRPRAGTREFCSIYWRSLATSEEHSPHALGCGNAALHLETSARGATLPTREGA